MSTNLITLISSSLIFERELTIMQDFPDSSVGKESARNAGDPSSVPGLGRSSGEGKGYPLQYPSLESSMDYIIHGVAKSQTQLSNFHFSSLQAISNSYKQIWVKPVRVERAWNAYTSTPASWSEGWRWICMHRIQWSQHNHPLPTPAHLCIPPPRMYSESW